MSLVLNLFREQAKKAPDALAAADKNGTLTYAELDRLTDVYARNLISYGIGREVFAAVYVKRNMDVVTAELSVLKAGGAFAPIDAAYPVERVNFIVNEAECPVILTERKLWAEKPATDYKGTVIFLDDALTDSAPDIPLPDPDENDSAFLLYTSGTTGKPKGVLHSHSSLWGAVRTLPGPHNPVREGSRVAVFGGFTFIAAVLYIFAPLTAGGSAFIVDEETRMNMDALYRFLRKNKITHCFLPPSLGTVMVGKYDMRGIRLYFAGEKLHPFTSLYPIDCANMFGSTEGVNVACYEIRGGEEDVPLGSHPEGVVSMIVDADGNEVPDGETGELLYSGDMSAREYRNLPELSAQKWTYINGRRYFHTGDRVKRDAEGLLHYVGRSDDMVKIHGFRVELGEVDSRIISCGVSPCACALKKVMGADKLCCFYEGDPVDTAKLENELREKLPAYMIPDVWIAMKALPRNANGKIARRLLPEPEPERKPYVPPTNDVDALVVKCIEQQLGFCPLGLDDCFVELGGDSIRAMSLSSELRTRGIILTSADILQAGSIRELCEKLRVRYEEIWDEDERAELYSRFEADGVHIEKVLPLSQEQEILLMNHLLQPDNPDRVEYLSFLLDCSPLEAELRKALDTLSEKFESLRASIVYQGVSAIQQVITDRKTPLSVYDAADSREAQRIAHGFREENGPFSFNLQNTPNVRLACVRVADGTSLLLGAVYKDFWGSAELCAYFRSLFDILKEIYPASTELEQWSGLLSLGEEEGRAEKSAEADGSYFGKMLSRSQNGREQSKAPENQIFTYSRTDDPRKFVFVHTANTGSEAYYNLAKRIGGEFSLAAFEQYNIYHPESAVYGLKNIAAKYLEYLLEYQPEGPYYLGGWCYGGMIAYEMACLLEEQGKQVKLVVMLDSQSVTNERLRALARENHRTVSRDYFENCPLFEDMRTRGMLETLIANYSHVAEDVINYEPTRYHGRVLYFKPSVIPEGSEGAALAYQEAIAATKAGGYENYIDPGKLKIVRTPHEHDLMMDDVSLDIIVPSILAELNGADGERMTVYPASLDGWEQLKNAILELPGVPRPKTLELCLMAEELFVNIASYAYPEGTPESERTVTVTVNLSDERIGMTFEDGGIPFNQQLDASALGDYDPFRQIGGAGRLLVMNMADTTSYTYKNGKNVFGFEKKLKD